ncbi:uncharacterized protein LOC120774603 [Bactrocera tryoni]|uniref:uncharacterized protein LOC120774603 n=1 Tax=Bactrocera tryoni TaxID=59916 RepID=UPI001A995148|nr:uncharacterized protein LOC120774603 [Bactrocera tryoni]
MSHYFLLKHLFKPFKSVWKCKKLIKVLIITYLKYCAYFNNKISATEKVKRCNFASQQTSGVFYTAEAQRICETTSFVLLIASFNGASISLPQAEIGVITGSQTTVKPMRW